VYGVLVHPKEVALRLVVGQFWAKLSPLTLLRIDKLWEAHFSATEWTPDCVSNDACYFKGADWEVPVSNFRYLWFNKVLDANGLQLVLGSMLGKVHAGDVWVMQHRDAEPGLIFVGPETNEKTCHVLADWAVDFGQVVPATVQLYQPGPGRSSPPPRSVYEHLRNPIF
jgi:hypothetical protein